MVLETIMALEGSLRPSLLLKVYLFSKLFAAALYANEISHPTKVTCTREQDDLGATFDKFPHEQTSFII